MYMTGKQKILKTLYPVFAAFSRVVGNKGNIAINKSNALPKKSIFELADLISYLEGLKKKS